MLTGYKELRSFLEKIEHMVVEELLLSADESADIQVIVKHLEYLKSVILELQDDAATLAHCLMVSAKRNRDFRIV